MTVDIIIVGAPRSGTNMLRDVLSSLPGFTTWPCDEINAIWKHGNRSYPSDELRAEHARPKVAAYLRSAFDRVRRAHDAHTVVEKTCANSLRVEFVAESFPKARYIFLYRDGIDAAASAMQRWNAPFNLKYTAKKARYVPVTDVPYYAKSFASRMISARLGGVPASGGVASWWGPRPCDARELQVKHSLDELALIQWQRCVNAAIRGLEKLPGEQVLDVQYERFVANPPGELSRILDFLGCGHLAADANLSGITARSVGKGRSTLAPARVARLESLARETLARLDYV